MEETFKITDDKTAEWALGKIKEAEDERDRLVTLADEKINELVETQKKLIEDCQNDTAFLRSCLFEYFGSVPHKETKTQETYQLLSAKLIMKKPSLKITHDDEKLLEFCDNEFYSKYLKIKKSIDWAELKKNVTISDNEVISTETGEIIEGCAIEEDPGKFEIKF